MPFPPMTLAAVSRFCVVAGCVLAEMLALRAALAAPEPVRLGPDEAWLAIGRHVETLEDASRALGIDEVRHAPRFEPLDAETPNFGYSRSAHWLRFSVANASSRRAVYLLEVPFPSIDEIDLYRPVAGARGAPNYELERGGDLQPFAARAIQHRNHVFRLALAPGETQTYYLRASTQSVLTVPLHLWREEAFEGHDRLRQLAYGALYGGALALFLYNLMLFLWLRDPAYLFYVLYTASFGVYLATFDGFAFQYLWPGSVWWANHALATALSLTLAFGALFGRTFLALPRIAPRIGALMGGISAGGLVLAVCAATGLGLDYGGVLRSISLLAPVAAIATLWVAVRESLRGYRPAKFFLLAWSALLVFIVLGALRNFALVPTTFVTVNGLHIGFALDILLLSFALGDRINEMKRAAARAQAEALATQQALLEATRASERELERRIAERTVELHEVNERLRAEALEGEALMAQLREREQHLRFMAQHDALTGLPNRMSMQQRLALALELAKRNRKKAAVMVIDLDDFKRINDTHGHAAGDQALIEVAMRLRTSMRASDTVARYGGDEFVVLVGELEHAEDAGAIAEKIADVVRLPLALENGVWNIGCSIGTAVYPDDAADGETLIRLADKAMYRSKAKSEARLATFRPAQPAQSVNS